MTLLIIALVLLALGAAAGWLLWVNVINNAAYPLGVGIAGAGVALLVLLVLFALAPTIANRIDAGIAQVRTSTASPTDKATPTVQARTDATAVPQATAAATQIPQATARPANTAVPPTPVPAPAPTAASTTSWTVASPPGGFGHRCPTDKEMMDAHGFTAANVVKATASGVDVVWDNCKWTVAAVGIGSIPNVKLLPGWQYTLTTTATDLPSVWYGTGAEVTNLSGATIRYREVYDNPDNQWVNQPCRPYASETDKGGLFSREKIYGETRTPAYATRNGNLPC